VDLLLTDRLACPRCGPEFGLILLADRLEDRRVHEGGLGCANCRDSYPVRGGVGDLRPAPRGPLPDVEGNASEGGPSAVEIGGLLGIMRGPGHILLAGALANHARALADLIEEIEVVAARSGREAGEEKSGVSRMVVRGPLPLQSRSLRGVALVQSEGLVGLDEAARVVAPGGRLVVFGAAPDGREFLEDSRLHIVAEDGSRLVASR